MKPSLLKIIGLLLLLENVLGHLQLLSSDVKEGQDIPLKFTPYSNDVSPSFSWENSPKETRSFAFTVEDPDAPSGLFYHWVLINIPKTVSKLESGKFAGKAIRNSWGITKYKGPRPPYGTHHYHFVIYALDVESISVRSFEDFSQAIKGHVIEKAEIVSLFSHREDL